MAHYAFLDMANVVTEVIVGRDEGDTNTNWELEYQDVRKQVCKRTSYNTQGGVHSGEGTPYRKNYAGIGYTCLLYTSPSPRDQRGSRMPSSA